MGGPELAAVPTRPPRAFIWCPALPRGVWVCQPLGFRNFPREGSQSFRATANEETGASGERRGREAGGSFPWRPATGLWPPQTAVHVQRCSRPGSY